MLRSDDTDGSGQLQLVLAGEHRQWATSADLAGAIATYEQHPVTLRDMWIVSADRSRAAFLATPFQERAGRYSPDGKWLAYVSNDSGRDEVYVRPATGSGEHRPPRKALEGTKIGGLRVEIEIGGAERRP